MQTKRSVEIMAMNFKVFDNSQLVAEYAADIIRKQFNNNPTTIAGFHLDTDQAPVLDELKKNIEKHAVDFSQINILDYDDKKSYFEALGVPAGLTSRWVTSIFRAYPSLFSTRPTACSTWAFTMTSCR